MWCMFSGDFTPKSGVTLISYPNPGLYCVRIELARTMCSFSFLMPSLSCPISAGQWAALGCNLAGRQMCSLDNTHWWEKRMDYTPGHAHVSDSVSVSDTHTHTPALFSQEKISHLMYCRPWRMTKAAASRCNGRGELSDILSFVES